MTAEEKPIREFMEAVSNSPNLWGALDLRILAIRIAGDWHNLLTRCYLRSSTPDAIVPLKLPENVGERTRQLPEMVLGYRDTLERAASADRERVRAPRLQRRSLREGCNGRGVRS